ncbi:MAG TPA: LacI family DNA-binding transcriptional regulator [Candidatus Limnocylindrales bacterium]|nr:LacI family DNA-binding transcriptional regulator [Candidatus Limnocylindrales bacterium]
MTEVPSSEKPRSITIVDVARAAGVSYSTVSRVLNGYEFVKESTREKVLASAEQLGYVANMSARSLAGGHSQIIGVVVPGLDNGYIGEIVRGIDEELARVNYDLMMYTTHRQLGRESRYVSAMANGLADGLLLVAPLVPAEILRALPQHDFPHVLIDQSEPTNTSSVVDATNWQGAYDGTRYLIELGHRRIGHITGTPEIASAGQRIDGYRAALLDHGLPFDERLLVEGNFYQDGGFHGAAALLELPERPTAIFAANDLSALGAIDAIRARGLRIPEDISLLGFDDIPHAQIAYPKLTTVRQPLAQMGRVAARLLLDQIQQPERPPRRVTLATELVIRDSCALAPGA